MRAFSLASRMRAAGSAVVKICLRTAAVVAMAPFEACLRRSQLVVVDGRVLVFTPNGGVPGTASMPPQDHWYPPLKLAPICSRSSFLTCLGLPFRPKMRFSKHSLSPR